MAAYTITLPPATQAEIDGLIADLRTAVQKYSTLADKMSAAVPSIQTDVHTTAAAVAAAIPAIQGDVNAVAAKVASIKVPGWL
jgi:hypothetical protein